MPGATGSGWWFRLRVCFLTYRIQIRIYNCIYWPMGLQKEAQQVFRSLFK